MKWWWQKVVPLEEVNAAARADVRIEPTTAEEYEARAQEFTARRDAALAEGRRVAVETLAGFPLANEGDWSCSKCGSTTMHRKFEAKRRIGTHDVPMVCREVMLFQDDRKSELVGKYVIWASVLSCSCARCGVSVGDERPLDGGEPWLEAPRLPMYGMWR